MASALAKASSHRSESLRAYINLKGWIALQPDSSGACIISLTVIHRLKSITYTISTYKYLTQTSRMYISRTSVYRWQIFSIMSTDLPRHCQSGATSIAVDASSGRGVQDCRWIRSCNDVISMSRHNKETIVFSLNELAVFQRQYQQLAVNKTKKNKKKNKKNLNKKQQQQKRKNCAPCLHLL